MRFQKLSKHSAGALALAGSVLLASSAAVAGPGTQQFGPFVLNTTDGGSCGNSWANDTFERRYTVISNGEDNFTVREKDKGAFVTIAGESPGACETTPHHGAIVGAGITGNIVGSADFTVDSATYNPNGCNADPSVCSTRAGFVTAVFGGGAVATIAFTAFNFEYASSDQSLAYHHWQDKSDQAVNDKFEGDIAN
jgi:hypothetical protein